MKKFYFLILVFLAINSAIAQGCLPQGITFTTQEQIDNFQTDYPGCTEIGGDVQVKNEDDNITNLNGLSVLTSIGGFLNIELNNELTSLTGLDNVDSIGGFLWIDNNIALTGLTGLDNVTSIGGNLIIYNNIALTSLSGLENVASIEGGIAINHNNALTSLSGLENIEAGSITYLSIKDNLSLSTCEVLSVCNYLSTPTGEVLISNNAPGCNSREEVEAACLVGIQNIIQENKFSIFPNPSSSRFTIQFTLENEEQVKLLVLNNLGQVVATLANETIAEGQHELNWNAEGMPAGVYFYNIQIGKQAGTGKMMLMK